jgi:dUTP pyrophosphatase
MEEDNNTWKRIKSMVDSENGISDVLILSQMGLDKGALEELERRTVESAMDSIKVRVKFTNNSDNLDPTHKYLDDSGMDLRANLPDGDMTISCGKVQLVPTGLHFELPESMEIQVRPRSGLAVKHGVTVLNTPGTVDRGYTGEVKVILINHGESDFNIKHGDRIAQAVISPVISGRWCKLIKSDTLSDTDRSEGGFGSTGKK